MKAKLIVAAVAAISATSANAVAVTSVQIGSAANVPGQGYLQVAELQLFSGGTNVALGKTATATSVYVNGPAVPANAVDGDTRGDYPFIFHSNNDNGSDLLTVDLGGLFQVGRISIFGRTDVCCTFRDVYSYTLFNGGTAVRSGTLDASTGSFATAAVPEPAAWALMILGFGLVGTASRRRRRLAPAA